jgi:hypothetical protein
MRARRAKEIEEMNKSSEAAGAQHDQEKATYEEPKEARHDDMQLIDEAKDPNEEKKKWLYEKDPGHLR